ncbi:MAG: nitrogen fixation protein NifX [Hydrococcus sp. Prado102]|jgi:nitrogen fixation protein NifX|nr:nitrogen fixation protein NifX [Hydrococcus sp. Prado102]
MKIAFTTTNRTHINAHFGSAKSIDVYEVSPEGYEFLNTITFGGNLDEDGNEDKLTPKVEALKDCTIVYVSAIGSSAASRLIKQGITPLRSKTEADAVEDTLNELVKTLNGNPPPWLRKALQQRNSSFDDLEEEEEEELTV